MCIDVDGYLLESGATKNRHSRRVVCRTADFLFFASFYILSVVFSIDLFFAHAIVSCVNVAQPYASERILGMPCPLSFRYRPSQLRFLPPLFLSVLWFVCYSAERVNVLKVSTVSDSISSWILSCMTRRIDSTILLPWGTTRGERGTGHAVEGQNARERVRQAGTCF